jgi:hypothetical protein
MKSSGSLCGATYVDMLPTGAGSDCLYTIATLLEIMGTRKPGEGEAGSKGSSTEELCQWMNAEARQREHRCREANRNVWPEDDDLDLSREVRCVWDAERGDYVLRW